MVNKPLVLALALSGAVGCMRPVSVQAPVLYPAMVPVRAFPNITVAGGDVADDDLGARLAQYLAQDGQHNVQHVAVHELEPLRNEHAFSPVSLVVLLEAGLYDDAREGWQRQPVSACNFMYGCTTQYQDVYASQPVVAAQVKLTIYAGPTATPLQVTTIDAAINGYNTPGTRRQVLEQLSLKLQRAVDVIRSETSVDLEPVRKHPIVDHAIAHIRKGQWAEGRALLETAARELGGLKHDVQARIWYDLGIARWYAPGPDGLTQEAYAAAKRALGWAHKLDGTQRYTSALEALERARRRSELLDEQRLAAKHNYALIGAMPAPESAQKKPE